MYVFFIFLRNCFPFPIPSSGIKRLVISNSPVSSSIVKKLDNLVPEFVSISLNESIDIIILDLLSIILDVSIKYF